MRNLGRPRATALLLVAVTAGLVTGCGSTGGPNAGPSSGATDLPSTTLPSPAPSSPDPASPSSGGATMHPGPGPKDPSVPPSEDAARLSVRYSADGTTQQVWTLTCAPNGGTHPDPAAACAALASAGTTPFAKTPPDQQCTQIYGGPQTAVVSGTWRGQTVAGTFARTNGCEVSRWHQLVGLLPDV